MHKATSLKISFLPPLPYKMQNHLISTKFTVSGSVPSFQCCALVINFSLPPLMHLIVFSAQT